MRTHIAYDDVAVRLIPRDAPAVAAYINGRYANETAVRKAFPHATIRTISVFDDGRVADFYDCENGDYTPAKAAAVLARDVRNGLVPGVYMSVSATRAVMFELAAQGIPRDRVLLWTAHYTGVPHICGPNTCRYSQLVWSADGTQFTDLALGRSLDESEVTDAWLGVTPAPPSLPVPRGHAVFTGAIDLQTAQVSWVHGLPAPGVHFAGGDVDQWMDAKVQVNLRDGAWRPA